MNENNDNLPTDEQIIQGIEFATEKKRAQNALVGFGIIFVIGYLGGKAGARSTLKEATRILQEMEHLCENVNYNADVSYMNVQDTVKNGQIILDAIKKAGLPSA